jgi:hypothetical protein
MIANHEDASEREKFSSRKQLYKEWKAKHVISFDSKAVKAGDKIDVRDTEYIWCSGEVELKIYTLNRSPLLYIHYEVSLILKVYWFLGLEQKIRRVHLHKLRTASTSRHLYL